MNYHEFFQAATGWPPYEYQCRLACGPGASLGTAELLRRGAQCRSQLIDIPTGLGKTAAVVLGWLWNRLAHPDSSHRIQWPRRLAYCLPMRTLVEQTREEVAQWIRNLAEILPGNEDLQWLAANSPIILMGGEEAVDWDMHPERPAILICTQDMLISRALNRGYGMSRYRWPMHFALLNNDCLWIMDEIQLMGVSVETSAQLDGFRQLPQWPSIGISATWWMSATLDESRLATVDHPKPPAGWGKILLSESERAAGAIHRLVAARKPVQPAAFSLSPSTKDNCAKSVADLVRQKHVPGTLTLVIANRVSRARKIYTALCDKKLGLDRGRIALIHSRFRPADRSRHTALLYGPGDRIVVATLAVEAGVDVSARLLITELAPWPSLVQRIGRCNRRGECENAEVVWIDIQARDDNDDLVLPYSLDGLNTAREIISSLPDAGPQHLAGVQFTEAPVIRPVLRRRDLLDLFDTTPDLCGQDLDISRYVRDGDDNDLQIYWRAVPPDSKPAPEEAAPRREELCRVPAGEAGKFIKKNRGRVWQWDYLREEWRPASHACPGALCLAAADCGGYQEDLGWTGEPNHKPAPLLAADGRLDSYRADPQTFARYWLELDAHAQGVLAVLDRLAGALALESAAAALKVAARWHDAGKAHPVFQGMLQGGEACRAGTLWAKSGGGAARCERPGFRHELASALAWLAAGPADAPERDLAAYLIAAHHGKVRLSIRALPDEKGDPADPARLFARGVWQGDRLPAIPGLLPGGAMLDLELMQMGQGEHGPSWLARTVALRDRLGPFRLAFFETLLRAADMLASREEACRLATRGAQAPQPGLENRCQP